MAKHPAKDKNSKDDDGDNEEPSELGKLPRDVTAFDPARTEIHFLLGDVLHKVNGSFQLKRGTIQFDASTGKAGGELVVDVISGDSGNASRDRRMRSCRSSYGSDLAGRQPPLRSG